MVVLVVTHHYCHSQLLLWSFTVLLIRVSKSKQPSLAGKRLGGCHHVYPSSLLLLTAVSII